ncbi:MAG: proton-conducting transporter transmembrane domain-containing protein, partial [Halobacteriota archaeon]
MYIIYTLIIPLVVAVICAFLSRNSKMCAYVAGVGMTISAVLFTADWYISTSATTYLDSAAAAAGLSSSWLIVAYPVIIIGTFITWFSLAYIKNAGRIYYPLLLVIIGATATAVISTNLVTLYALLEIGTLSTAILVMYRRGRAFEAATKFIILNSIGSSFTLIALILMFVSYGTSDIASFGSIPSNTILLISLFLLIGLGTKIGVVPMHSWVPDTYGESPIPVSAFLAGTVKGASAFILIRLLFA